MTTALDTLAEALLVCRAFASGAEAAPEAVLWFDPGMEFTPILPALRTRLPNLLCFGDYDAAARTGPALWLRAAATRQVLTVEWPLGEPPVIYLPAYGRDVLRCAEDCPPELQSLVWFAVTGASFGQPRQARDWTLRSFLAAQGSPLGLDVPEDKATRDALTRTVAYLFMEPLHQLRGQRLDATALDRLLVPDSTLDMLRWMDGGLTPQTDPERFEAFATLATKNLGLDPRKRTRQDAAARLAKREKGWADVWHRFEEGGGNYEGVVTMLRTEEPQDLIAPPDTYPAENTRREATLRSSMLALASKSYAEAAKALVALDKDHGWRRATVWARRGEAKLAGALQHLALIAGAAALPSIDAVTLANAYAAEGWRIDAAALQALDIVRTGDNRDAVIAALRTVYLPWLDAGAAALQELADQGRVPFTQPATPPKPPQAAALIFVDGMRMDVGQRLVETLRSHGARATLDWRWSGFPTVTATCKPLASPAAGVFVAGVAETLAPAFHGKLVTKPVLTKAVAEAGWTTTDELLATSPVWREAGRFDEEGHSRGSRLAEGIADGVAEIAELALKLARQGRRVRIVTDHGWLLVPGGLRHADLPSGMTAPNARGNRVAMLKEGAQTTHALLPWSWDSSVLFATPHGACAFYKGTEYAHGGVSPQECVLPVIDVTADGIAASLSIKATWQRLRLRIEVTGGAGMMFDLRPAADAFGPTLLPRGARLLDDVGQVNVLVSDEHVGKEVCLVVHPPGAPTDVLAKQMTTIEG